MKLTIAKPIAVPSDITVCPECGGILIVQATTPDIRDIILDCRNDTRRNPHRNWQGEWELPYALVRSWVERGCKPRAIVEATLLGSRTANGYWSGQLIQAGTKVKADLNTIRTATIDTGIGISGTTYTGEFIDIERDGNGRFWPWPTELLEFKRPDKRRPTTTPREEGLLL